MMIISQKMLRKGKKIVKELLKNNQEKEKTAQDERSR